MFVLKITQKYILFFRKIQLFRKALLFFFSEFDRNDFLPWKLHATQGGLLSIGRHRRSLGRDWMVEILRTLDSTSHPGCGKWRSRLGFATKDLTILVVARWAMIVDQYRKWCRYPYQSRVKRKTLRLWEKNYSPPSHQKKQTANDGFRMVTNV